jgi:hypothetical protein
VLEHIRCIASAGDVKLYLERDRRRDGAGPVSERSGSRFDRASKTSSG